MTTHRPPHPTESRSCDDLGFDDRLARLAARRNGGQPGRPAASRAPTTKSGRHHPARGSRAAALALSFTATVGLAGFLRQASAGGDDGSDSLISKRDRRRDGCDVCHRCRYRVDGRRDGVDFRHLGRVARHRGARDVHHRGDRRRHRQDERQRLGIGRRHLYRRPGHEQVGRRTGRDHRGRRSDHRRHRARIPRRRS